MDHVCDLFEEHGADVWFEKEATDLLPEGAGLPQCGGHASFTKETDILDVWFDSGVSHAAVLEDSATTCSGRRTFTWKEAISTGAGFTAPC